MKNLMKLIKTRPQGLFARHRIVSDAIGETLINQTSASPPVAANENCVPGPEDLPPSQPRGASYPVHALGPRGASAARAIENMVQSPAGLGAQSVLATMSLATSGLGTVSTLLDGNEVPATLYCMTIAVSGERKSASDGLAIGPLRRFQEELIDQYKQACAEYRSDCRNRVKGEPEPEEPRLDAILCDDPTYEGLLKIGAQCAGFLGWFTDEGASFVGGYSMGREQRSRTIGGLSRLWDGRATIRPRATGNGVEAIPAFPLSMHIMFQPKYLEQTYGDELLNAQGILARVLPSWPASTMGNRPYRPATEVDRRAVADFGNRALDIADSVRLGQRKRRNMTLEPGAFECLRILHDEVEAEIGAAGRYGAIAGFAAKTAEHAARMAAVIARFEDPDAGIVGETAMQGACTLARFYLEETLHIGAAANADDAMRDAGVLRDWLVARLDSGQAFSMARLQQHGPYALRNGPRLKAAVSILQRHRWVVALPENAVVDGKARRQAYCLNPRAVQGR